LHYGKLPCFTMLKCLAKGGGFIQGGRSKGIGKREPHHMLIVLSLFGKRVRHKITEKGMGVGFVSNHWKSCKVCAVCTLCCCWFLVISRFYLASQNPQTHRILMQAAGLQGYRWDLAIVCVGASVCLHL